jgi:hypothetical protein
MPAFNDYIGRIAVLDSNKNFLPPSRLTDCAFSIDSKDLDLRFSLL